jgi:hypothetical protein
VGGPFESFTAPAGGPSGPIAPAVVFAMLFLTFGDPHYAVAVFVDRYLRMRLPAGKAM